MRRLVTQIALAALLASLARAQDPPIAPPVAPPVAPAPDPEAPPAEPVPYTIRLPEVASEAARAAGVPTVLVAVGGFLIASSEPPDAMRVDGDRVFRMRDGVETLAALRLNQVGLGDDAGAGVGDDAARALLALDIDASRPDLAAWLARIDPVRCAVRVRLLGLDVVPKLPETLQLIEVVAQGRRAGPEALPALASARRIALYGFDYSNAPGGVRGDAVDERREARFRAAHAGAIVVTSPRPAFDAAVAGCDLVRVRTGGAKPRVVDLVQGAAATAFLAELEFDDGSSFWSSPRARNVRSPEEFVVELAQGGRVLLRLAHVADARMPWPGGRMAWIDGPWPGVVALRGSSGYDICRRLDQAGVRGPYEAWERRIGVGASPSIRRRRQDQPLGEGATRLLLDGDHEGEAPEAIRDPAVALRVIGCSEGNADDRVATAATTALGAAARDAVLGAAAANAEDAELQLGFALWLWALPSRDFLTEEQKPILERTARLLAADMHEGTLLVAVRALRDLKLVEPLRRVLVGGWPMTVLPYPSQIQAAAALVDLGDAESVPKIREIRDASEDLNATAALDEILARAVR